MKSIHRQLLVSLIAALSIGTLLIALLLYKKSATEINELYDNNMQMLASTLTLHGTPFNLAAQPMPKLQKYAAHSEYARHSEYATHSEILEEEEFLIQVWNPAGEQVYTSHPLIAFPKQSSQGFHITRFQQAKWRVVTQSNEHGVIQISQPQHARHIYIWQLASGLLLPVLLQIPLIGIFIWIAVGRSLRPLNKVSRDIQARSASSLVPLNPETAPREIQPLIGELNHLLGRLGSAIELQRSFTADAAHELRTPLAALQLQADILARSQSEGEREQALQSLQKGIGRASNLVAQLLTLARLGPEYSKPSSVIELQQLVQHTLEDYFDLATAKGIDLGCHSQAALFINGNADNLRIMIGNLIDNAIRYSPEKSLIDILLYKRDDAVVLEIQDSAALIPASEQSRLFERFYRGSASQQVAGSGLGLAIVSDVVAQHLATIEIKARPDNAGNAFIVSFPPLHTDA